MSDVIASELDWKAESDARTLAEAEIIKGDNNRLNRAQIAAAKIAAEESEKARAMKKIAGRKAAGNNSTIRTRGMKIGGNG